MSRSGSPLNAFVASTPLQLISCTEAREHYGCTSDSTLLIIARPDNKVTESQMEFLIDRLGWRGIETVYLRKETFYLRLGYEFQRLGGRQIGRLFIGNKSSWIHEIFYLGLYWDQLVFVDDGLATVRYYHALHGEGLVSRISRGKRRLLAAMGIHLHQAAPDKVSFFTCFPLPTSQRIEVEVHDFPIFRKTFTACEVDAGRTPLVGFLGQPFGGEGRLQQLKAQIQHVVERHQNTHIVYFMHRKEVRKDLERTLSGFPVEVRQARRPIEVEVAMSGDPYIAFYSFTSTALFTLKKIFPHMSIFQVDDPAMGAKVPFYNEITTLFAGAGIKKTEL